VDDKVLWNATEVCFGVVFEAVKWQCTKTKKMWTCLKWKYN